MALVPKPRLVHFNIRRLRRLLPRALRWRDVGLDAGDARCSICGGELEVWYKERTAIWLGTIRFELRQTLHVTGGEGDRRVREALRIFGVPTRNPFWRLGRLFGCDGKPTCLNCVENAVGVLRLLIYVDEADGKGRESDAWWLDWSENLFKGLEVVYKAL